MPGKVFYSYFLINPSNPPFSKWLEKWKLASLCLFCRESQTPLSVLVMICKEPGLCSVPNVREECIPSFDHVEFLQQQAQTWYALPRNRPGSRGRCSHSGRSHLFYKFWQVCLITAPICDMASTHLIAEPLDTQMESWSWRKLTAPSLCWIWTALISLWLL